MEVKVGISNRHIHITEEHLRILFPEVMKLEKRNDLLQPGEYASTLTLTVKTTKDRIENVRLLGPTRDYTQVEISKTDAYKLGLNPPIRTSGDLDDSETITLVSPYGELTLNNACIIANRHIHLNSKERKEKNLEGITEVKVRIKGDKGAILDHVYLKEAEDYTLELHLDTDDGNATLSKTGDIVEVIIER